MSGGNGQSGVRYVLVTPRYHVGDPVGGLVCSGALVTPRYHFGDPVGGLVVRWMAPHGPAPAPLGGRRPAAAAAAQSCREHQMASTRSSPSQWHLPPNGDWGEATLWWRGGTSTSGTTTLASFPKTFPLAVERRRRKPTFDKFPKFFSPGPSCRDVASVAPSRPILTQQFEGKVGHTTYVLQRN